MNFIENFLFLAFHPFYFFFGGVLVIITRQMKNAVNQEKIKLLFDRKISRGGISLSRFDGYDNIAEHPGIDIAVFTFLQGKRKNIGRLISIQILFVQFPDIFIISKTDADFLVKTLKKPENFRDRAADFFPVNFEFGLPVFDLNFH